MAGVETPSLAVTEDDGARDKAGCRVPAAAAFAWRQCLYYER
jgi:hypothetical protein